MTYTPTQLRAELYRVLDEVLRTSRPIEIVHKGRRLKLGPSVPSAKLTRLEAHHDYLVGDPDDLVRVNWSRFWKPVL